LKHKYQPRRHGLALRQWLPSTRLDQLLRYLLVCALVGFHRSLSSSSSVTVPAEPARYHPAAQGSGERAGRSGLAAIPILEELAFAVDYDHAPDRSIRRREVTAQGERPVVFHCLFRHQWVGLWASVVQAWRLPCWKRRWIDCVISLMSDAW
jgi:hypothetical protein